MEQQPNILLEVMREPDRMGRLQIEDWNVLIPQARATGLMGHLAMLVAEMPEAMIPAEVRWHLESSRVATRTHATAIVWETVRLDRVLAGLGIPVVLLKGPAYMLLGLPIGRGRLCRDIDLLVPLEQLKDVESCLLCNGWEAKEMEPHQERFFRNWLHEVPAMTHRERGIEVDIHHNILPCIDSIRIDANTLLAASCPLDGYRCMRVLESDDRLLHSAAHLFRRGFYQNGLRDLVDMDGMLRTYVTDTEWDRLLKRAADLKLNGPLFLAIKYTKMFLGTPIPPRVLDAVGAWRPYWPPLWMLDCLVWMAVVPPRRDGRTRFRELTHWMLERYPLSLMRKSILPKLQGLYYRG